MTYVSEVTADSPVAWWRLGESATGTAEEVNNAYDGTYVTGGTFAQTGAVGDGDTAVLFDGVDDYATLTTLGTFGANVLTASIEFWVKTTSTTYGAVVGELDSGTSMVVRVGLNADTPPTTVAGRTCLQIRGNSSTQLRGYITTNIYDGNWHHVVWVVQGNTTAHKCWVDGVERSVTMSLTQTLATPNNLDFPVALAASNSAGTISGYAAATIDEVAFYTTQLSEARIQAHYNATIAPTKRLAALGVG